MKKHLARAIVLTFLAAALAVGFGSTRVTAIDCNFSIALMDCLKGCTVTCSLVEQEQQTSCLEDCRADCVRIFC